MTNRIICVLAAGFLSAAIAVAAQQKPVHRTADGHPDLSGGWTFGIDLAPAGLKKVVDGKLTTITLDQSARHRVAENVPGALPWTKAPSYKPEFLERVSDLAAHESKVDGVFYCGRPGVPRIGSRRAVRQAAGGVLFLFEEIFRDPHRI